jgi:asparaginyl-tRNA synthetase
MFGAIMRSVPVLSFAVHSYFQEKGFVYVNTPIITGSVLKVPVKCLKLRFAI